MRRLLILGVLSSGCLLPESPRRYAVWERSTEGAQVLADCAEVDAWVSKSGKEGVGVTLELRGRSTAPCVVTIASAKLRVGADEVAAKALPEPPTLRLGQRVHAYLAFSFDGDRAWNAGLEGALILGAPQTTVTFPLRQTMPKREDCEPR
ncbi:MAG: hypothetical protein HYV09_05720 [Deltaproteobacteria bacterium]|nr:hypothetical protein [Deltaproteobacteria bacterium]